MRFGQLIAYKMRKNFLGNLLQKMMKKLFTDLFLSRRN